MARLDRRDWMLAAWARFGAEGVDGVRVEALARDLGSTKGSFYWHFDNREGLLLAMLEAWERAGTDAIIAAVEEVEGRAPADKFRALAAVIFDSHEHDAVEVGVRSWARHYPPAQQTLARVDARRTAYVAGLLEGAGVPADAARRRAAVVYRALVGDFAITAAGGRALDAGEVREICDLALS